VATPAPRPRVYLTVVRAHGESGITARLEPATIDGLVYASSMVVLYAARHRVPVPSLARWLLGLGIAATLTANMAQGWSHGPVGAVVSAWPTVSLVGSYELLIWLIRASGTVEHRPPAGNLCISAGCRAAGRSATTTATGAELPRRGERGTPDQARQPMAQVAGSAIPASGQRDQAVPEAGAVNCAAVAAYQLSALAGNPLSERKLAQMFGRTSRRWARARIADARRVPSSRLTEEPAITIGAQLPSWPASSTRPSASSWTDWASSSWKTPRPYRRWAPSGGSALPTRPAQPDVRLVRAVQPSSSYLRSRLSIRRRSSQLGLPAMLACTGRSILTCTWKSCRAAATGEPSIQTVAAGGPPRS
jgi:hypothetical protein